MRKRNNDALKKYLVQTSAIPRKNYKLRKGLVCVFLLGSLCVGFLVLSSYIASWSVPVRSNQMDASSMMNSTLVPTTMDHSHHQHHHDHGQHDMAADNGGVMYDNGHMDHSNHQMDHAMMDHSMKMYFHFSQNAVILFESWSTHSWQGMLGSCIAVFIMAALYEGLKVLREFLLRRSNVMVRYSTMPVPTNDDVHITETQKTVGAKMLSCAHFIQTLLHILQVIVSYFLMLIFMTYNVWLCIAVGLGAGVGYFLFSWRRAIVVDINEHCH